MNDVPQNIDRALFAFRNIDASHMFRGKGGDVRWNICSSHSSGRQTACCI